jgi:hypothetical protein
MTIDVRSFFVLVVLSALMCLIFFAFLDAQSHNVVSRVVQRSSTSPLCPFPATYLAVYSKRECLDEQADLGSGWISWPAHCLEITTAKTVRRIVELAWTKDAAESVHAVEAAQVLLRHIGKER